MSYMETPEVVAEGQEPERPPSPEPTYATYDLPADLDTPIASTSKSVDIRLVGNHPLWGHHL